MPVIFIREKIEDFINGPASQAVKRAVLASHGFPVNKWNNCIHRAAAAMYYHTIVDPRVRVEVSIWIPPGADAMRAVAALNRQEDVEASVAEVDKEGVRLVAATWARDFSERGSVAAGLRVSCLEILRVEGLSSNLGT